MAYDPSDPDTFEDDDPAELDVEAPENDAAEQQTEVTADRGGLRSGAGDGVLVLQAAGGGSHRMVLGWVGSKG